MRVIKSETTGSVSAQQALWVFLRIESIAGRKPGTVECARDRALNYREAGSERACGARANHNQQGREPLGQLGMLRGDGRCACGGTLSRSGEALLKGHL